MGNNDNMREKIFQRPTVTDIKPSKLQSFMESYGFELKRVRGSHYIYEYSGFPPLPPIPMHDPIKPAYIDMIRKKISEIEGGAGCE